MFIPPDRWKKERHADDQRPVLELPLPLPFDPDLPCPRRDERESPRGIWQIDI